MASPYSKTNTTAFVLLLCICYLPTYTTAAKILCFFPELMDSQLFIHCRIAHVLAGMGHNVTVIAPAPNPIILARYNFKYVPLSIDKLRRLPSVATEYYNSLWNHMTLLRYNLELSDLILQEDTMKRWFVNAKTDDFDLLILSYQANDFPVGLAKLYNCPVILSTTRVPTLDLHQLVGNPYELSYVPTEYWTIRQTRMVYIHTYMHIWKILWYQFFVLPVKESEIKKYYCKHFSCAGRTLAEARNRIALIFTNHHFTQSVIRPNVPAIVEIGGIHISDYALEITQELLSHIDSAENGFFYINLGTNYNCSDVPIALTNILYDYFTTNREFVVWRWAYCMEPPTSPYIHYQFWSDQNAMLAHPKLKVFITHGSQNSLTEALHYNAKMLAITHTPEQEANVGYLVAQGAMLHLKDVDVISPQTLHYSLYSLLHDPSFKEACTILSQKYRDRPLTPRHTVLYWVNYVLRYRGAVHLRSPAVDLPYLQLIGLDFVLVTLAFLLAFYCATTQIRKLFKQPPLPKKKYDYIMANPANMFKIDETNNYQIRPTSSDDTAGEETAGEEMARKGARRESAGPVMQPNRPGQPQQRKNSKKNKRK